MKQNLEEALQQEKLKYYKNWRANNKEKIKKYNKNFWLKKLKEGNNND